MALLSVETAQRSLNVLKLLGELADIGNPNALSDVGVGAQLALVAIRGASYNVRANLDSISDRVAADTEREQMKGMINQSSTIAEQVEAKMKVCSYL